MGLYLYDKLFSTTVDGWNQSVRVGQGYSWAAAYKDSVDKMCFSVLKVSQVSLSQAFQSILSFCAHVFYSFTPWTKQKYKAFSLALWLRSQRICRLLFILYIFCLCSSVFTSVMDTRVYRQILCFHLYRKTTTLYYFTHAQWIRDNHLFISQYYVTS